MIEVQCLFKKYGGIRSKRVAAYLIRDSSKNTSKQIWDRIGLRWKIRGFVGFSLRWVQGVKEIVKSITREDQNHQFGSSLN